MKRIRLGFIGCGTQSASVLQPSAAQVGEIELTTFCDLIAEKAQRSAYRFGAKTWYQDYEEMLDKEQLDAVAVVGNPQMHIQIGQAVMRRKLHLFVEKPSANYIADAWQMCQTQIENGVYGMVGLNFRHAEPIRHLVDIVHYKDFGKPVHFSMKFMSTKPSSIEWDNPTLEWSWLSGQAVHAIDLAYYMMGEIVSVHALQIHGLENRVHWVVNLGFQSLAIGQLSFGSLTPRFELAVEVASDSGHIITVNDLYHLHYRFPKTSSVMGEQIKYSSYEWHPSPMSSGFLRAGYQTELQVFASSILKHEQPHASLLDSYNALLICEAITRSVVQGGPVNVAEIK